MLMEVLAPPVCVWVTGKNIGDKMQTDDCQPQAAGQYKWTTPVDIHMHQN